MILETEILKSDNVAICWFKNSENIIVAYKDKFEIFNVLSPDKRVLSVKCDLSNSIAAPPIVTFNDRIAIFRDKDNKLIFYDIKR